jgi:hypothetical protein
MVGMLPSSTAWSPREGTKLFSELEPMPRQQRAGRQCHQSKAVRARKHDGLYGYLQVQNIESYGCTVKLEYDRMR